MRPHLPFRLSVLPAVLMAALAGCAAVPPLPQIDDSAAQAAPYPALIPLGPVIAAAGEAGTAATGAPASAAMDSRLAALAARAAVLRGPVVPDATARRLAASLRQPLSLR